MISELKFVTRYSSYWRVITGNLENVVRRMNLTLERFDVPIAGRSAPERRAFLNELSFRTFAQTYFSSSFELEAAIRDAMPETRRRMQSFEGVTPDLLDPPTKSELREVEALQTALHRFVRTVKSPSDKVIFSPALRGCGIIETCEADLLIGDMLIEVKSGDRALRSVDLRQLITYCALNFAEKKYVVRRVGCVNPRRGTYFLSELNSLSLQISGRPAAELFSEILYFLSTEGVSW